MVAKTSPETRFDMSRKNCGLDVLFLDFTSGMNLPPLGLLYVASHLKAHGWRTGVAALDGVRGGFSKDYLRRLMEEHRPMVVGMPVFGETLVDAIHYTKWIREFGEARVMIGGPEATANPLAVFDRTGADAVVVGDGEDKALRLVEAWHKGCTPDDLRGLYVRRDGEILHDPTPAPWLDIDALAPPDFSLLLNPDRHIRTMVTGRGCPFRCTFCFEGRLHRYRMRSTESVVSELTQLFQAKKVRMFAFLDDTFTLDPQRLKAICETIKRCYGGPWFCEGRIGVLAKHPEIIDYLADAGLTRLQLGLESGSQRVLDAYCKQTDPEMIRRVFRRCHEVGITSVIGNFIVGGAFEDHETFKQTLDMAMDLIDQGPGSTELTTCYLYPYTGTAIQEHPERFDLEFVDYLPISNAANRVLCVNRTRALSRGEISQYRVLLDTMVIGRMLSHMDTLDPVRLARHLRYARDHGVLSTWYNAMMQCKPLAIFARLMLEHGGLCWTEVCSRDNWLRLVPIRAGYNAIKEEGAAITLTARQAKKVRISGFERRFFDLCGGKLSMEEMLPLLSLTKGRKRLDSGATVQAMRAACERLGNDFLLLFREV